MIASFFCEKWSKSLFLVGLFQFFLTYILIGWVFSIYWGYLIVVKSVTVDKDLKTFLDQNKLRSDHPGNI
jgi:hypothetical protein